MALPRVTHILKAAGLTPDFSTIPDDVMVAARERGSAVHDAILADHYGFDRDELPPEWAPYLDAYRKFAAETQHLPLVSEYEVVSRRWKYQGHLDRAGLLTLDGFTGHRTLLDWKSGGAKGVEVQLAGYMTAYNEMHPKEPVTRAAAVALRRDGTYRIHRVDIKAPLPCGFTPEQIWMSSIVNFYARGLA